MTETIKILKIVYNEGFNVYQLIHRVKHKLGWAKDRKFPEEVILNLCKQYLKDRKKIRNEWVWFVKVLGEKSAEYYAQKNIDENKKDESVPQSIKEIMRGVK